MPNTRKKSGETELWEELRADDFEDNFMSLLIETVGLSTAKKLVENFGGEAFYFPKKQSVLRMARNRRICKEYSSLTYRQLAKKYGLTVQYIGKIIKNTKKRSREFKNGSVSR